MPILHPDAHPHSRLLAAGQDGGIGGECVERPAAGPGRHADLAGHRRAAVRDSGGHHRGGDCVL